MIEDHDPRRRRDRGIAHQRRGVLDGCCARTRRTTSFPKGSRDIVLDIARSRGMSVHEQAFGEHDLHRLEELFLLATTPAPSRRSGCALLRANCCAAVWKIALSESGWISTSCGGRA